MDILIPVLSLNMAEPESEAISAEKSQSSNRGWQYEILAAHEKLFSFFNKGQSCVPQYSDDVANIR